MAYFPYIYGKKEYYPPGKGGNRFHSMRMAGLPGTAAFDLPLGS